MKLESSSSRRQKLYIPSKFQYTPSKVHDVATEITFSIETIKYVGLLNYPGNRIILNSGLDKRTLPCNYEPRS